MTLYDYGARRIFQSDVQKYFPVDQSTVTTTTRYCEDCEEETIGRRYRCPNCNKLVCTWCWYHIHKLAVSQPSGVI